MKVLIVILAAVLMGCSTPRMSNDSIITESRKCWAAGLMAHAVRGETGLVSDIECLPVEHK